MAKKKSKDIEVTVAEVVDYLRITGGFAPALRSVVVRKVAADAARKRGLKVSASELQRAADAFRMVNNLVKASDTKRWLGANGLTVDALEDFLETNLLVSKLKDKLEKSASKAKYLKTEGIKESVREMIYQDWLKTALK